MKIKYLLQAALVCSLLSNPAFALFDDKFEAEVGKEADAVKLARDTQSGGYELLTVAELKKMIDAKQAMVIVDTMPYEDSYKKEHIPGAKQFLFPIPRMNKWDAKETAGKSEADYAALLGADKNIPVIVCTSKSQETDKIWGMRQGAFDYMVKPIDHKTLLDKIRALG